MNNSEISILNGENTHQKAEFEINDKTIDYETSKNLTYIQMISLLKGLDIASEFYDVKCVCSIKGSGICAVALGQSVADAMQKVVETNSIDFMNALVVVSDEVDSESVKFLKELNVIVAPKFTKNAIEYMETHNITYVTISTPLKDYKKYLSNNIKITPLGTLTQTPNLSELDKDKFKVVSKQKPTVEQIEDAVFAWKVVKHVHSQGLVVAKDLKTSAISQGLQTASVEFAIDYSCELSKDAILASDMPLTPHDINVASQGRIGLIIVPSADRDVINQADKYSIGIITTGITNILY